MKMPSRYAFDREEGEAHLARILHREQDASRSGGYKMVRVSARTHVLMMQLKKREGHSGEWSLDAILYQLLLEELAAADDVYRVRSGHVTRADLENIEARSSALVNNVASSRTCIHQCSNPELCPIPRCIPSPTSGFRPDSPPPPYK